MKQQQHTDIKKAAEKAKEIMTSVKQALLNPDVTGDSVDALFNSCGINQSRKVVLC